MFQALRSLAQEMDAPQVTGCFHPRLEWFHKWEQTGRFGPETVKLVLKLF